MPGMARRRWFVRSGALTLFLLAACTSQPPSSAPGSVAPSLAPITTAPASGAPSPDGTLASPGTPYDATEVLAAMRDSRRPGGVPDELETDAVAAALAAALWTWDGQQWASWSVGGSCGPETCSLDVAGSPSTGAGTDLYSFVVDRVGGGVMLSSTDLHGHPPGLDARLDAIARGALEPAALDGLRLVSGRWLPPPDTDRYWLAYRSGGEEGAPRLDVLVDLASGKVLEVDDGS